MKGRRVVEIRDPEIALPVPRLAAAVGAVVVVGFGVGVAVGLFSEGIEAGTATAAVAALAVGLGVGGCVAGLRPWSPRRASRWPVLLFGMQGLSLLASGGIAGIAGWRLLYSAALLDVPVLLAVLPTSWIAAWIAIAKVQASALAAAVRSEHASADDTDG